MSIFQIPQKNTQELLNRQKFNKIYVFSRKKCNPFSITPTTLDPLKFNIFTHNPNITTTTKYDSLYYPTERLFQSENPKDSQPFSLQYQQQQRFQTLLQKRKSIKQKIVEHFRNSIIKSKQYNQKTCKLESFRQPKSIASKNLLSNLRKFDKSPNKTSQIQVTTQFKKSSLPDLSKYTKLQISSLTSSLKRKKIKGKQKLSSSIPINTSSEFMRTGMINGLKISNSTPKNILIVKTENHQQQKQTQQPSYNNNLDVVERQFSFVKKALIKNDNNLLNQKATRKNILQIRRRRSLEKESFKVTKLNGQSLIKIQKLNIQK